MNLRVANLSKSECTRITHFRDVTAARLLEATCSISDGYRGSGYGLAAPSAINRRRRGKE